MEELEVGVVHKAVESGVDLREFAKDVKKDMNEAQTKALLVYVDQAEEIADLHYRISDCDQILGNIETLLNNFQSSLKSMSVEIQSLQKESIEYSHKLNNRQAVRSDISQFVDDLVIPESMIAAIKEADVSDIIFKESLHELNHKIGFVKQQDFQGVRACEDVRHILDNLKVLAISKIRQFLLEMIYAIRRPLSNYQLPRDTMLENRFFQEFLLANDRGVAQEIQQEYYETMRKVYYSYFQEYYKKMLKLVYDDQPTKDDVIAADNVHKPSIFSTSKSMKAKANVFSLGVRGEVISEVGLFSAPIVPHAVEKGKTRYHHEAVLRSLFFALMDNSLAEHQLLADFFILKGKNVTEFFIKILGKTIAFVLKSVESYAQGNFDTIGLALTICICQKFKQYMLSKSNDALTQMWDDCISILFGPLCLALQANIVSIQNINVDHVSDLDLRPHALPRRFAEFASALHAINSSLQSEKLGQFNVATVSSIQKCMMCFAGSFNTKREQLVFLINNYQMMADIALQRATLDVNSGIASTSATNEGRSAAESLTPDPLPNGRGVASIFTEQLTTLTNEYASSLLQQHFANLCSFVQQTEPLLDAPSDEAGGVDERLIALDRKAAIVVAEFNERYRSALAAINQQTMQAFSDLRQAQALVQLVMTNLVQLYNRLLRVLSSPHFAKQKNDAVNLQALISEVKRYKPSY